MPQLWQNFVCSIMYLLSPCPICFFCMWAAGYAAQLAKKLEKVLRGLEPGGEEWKEAAALAERLRRPQGAEHGEN